MAERVCKVIKLDGMSTESWEKATYRAKVKVSFKFEGKG